LHRVHYVSQSQVDAPVGSNESWVISIWVKIDPATSLTVPLLADRILDRASDRGDALRRLVRAGYSPVQRSGYATSFVLLAEPEWYATNDIPRVRAADPGVSQLRYRITLDQAARADRPLADALSLHFHGHVYRGERQ